MWVIDPQHQIVHFGAFVGVVGGGSPVVGPVAVPAVSALLGGLKGQQPERSLFFSQVFFLIKT